MVVLERFLILAEISVNQADVSERNPLSLDIVDMSVSGYGFLKVFQGLLVLTKIYVDYTDIRKSIPFAFHVPIFAFMSMAF